MDRAAIKAARAARSKTEQARASGASGSKQTPSVRHRLGSLQPFQARQTGAADTIGAAVRNGVNFETKVLPYSQEVRWLPARHLAVVVMTEEMLQSVKKASTFGADLDDVVAAVIDRLTYWCRAIVREEPTENGMQHTSATILTVCMFCHKIMCNVCDEML